MKWQRDGKIAHILRIRAQKAGIPIHKRAGRKGTNMFDAVLGGSSYRIIKFSSN